MSRYPPARMLQAAWYECTDEPKTGSMSEQHSNNQPSHRGHVFLAEDDRNIRLLLARVLREEGFTVTEIEDGTKLLDRVRTWIRYGDRESLAAVVSDQRMPGATGLEVLELLRANGCTLPFVLISADLDAQLNRRTARLGASAVLRKPFDIDAFRESIVRVISRRDKRP